MHFCTGEKWDLFVSAVIFKLCSRELQSPFWSFPNGFIRGKTAFCHCQSCLNIAYVLVHSWLMQSGDKAWPVPSFSLSYSVQCTEIMWLMDSSCSADKVVMPKEFHGSQRFLKFPTFYKHSLGALSIAPSLQYTLPEISIPMTVYTHRKRADSSVLPPPPKHSGPILLLTLFHWFVGQHISTCMWALSLWLTAL